MSPAAHRVRVVGRGRAGGAFAGALRDAGWDVDHVAGRGADVVHADDVELVLLCVPDGRIAETAARVATEDAVVAHVAGSLGLSVLGDHARRGAIHPLVALSDPSSGAAALRGATFAVAGDPLCHEVVASLGGHAIEVADDHRAAYHAAAVIASNHLVGLLGQAERVAALAGVPLDAYLGLVRNTIDNVERHGPADALTGPASRGDDATIEAHLNSLPAGEHAAYLAGVELCRTLARGRDDKDRP